MTATTVWRGRYIEAVVEGRWEYVRRPHDRGAAVVLAAPGEDVFLALQLWGGEGSEGAARLAPLSAVIARQGGG